MLSVMFTDLVKNLPRKAYFILEYKIIYCNFIICLSVLTFLIPLINAEPRTYHFPEMCIQRQRFNNCSLQISSQHQNSCLIYNTHVCKKNEFNPWTLEPLYNPKLESNTEFTVNIEPYAFYVDDIQKSDPVSAINISLTSFNRNISGFSIIMNREAPPKNVCRIIDFRNSVDDIKIPFHFFYDCFVLLREAFWKNVLVTIIAYPLNIELTYEVFIPRVSETNSDLPCDWSPLLMVYCEGLSRNHIQLKFSKPQNDLNILFFVVNLLDRIGAEVDRIKIPASVKNDMISSEFRVHKDGYYSISVSIILPKKSCLVFKSHPFLVGIEQKDYTPVILIVLAVVMIVSTCILTYYLCQQYLTSVTSVLKPSLLLVYFHKQLQHEFLVMWAEYLTKHHGVNVYTLYKTGGNPKKWLDDITSKSNIIVFVISKGLAEVFDEEMLSCKEDHYWVEQLPEAKALISSLRTGEKVFCKVCFPFSEKQHVPRCLKHKGPLFRLLGKVDETKEFLCYIFNCSSKFRLLNKLCCIKHHLIKNADSMQKDLKDLKDKLKRIGENKFDPVSNINVNEENLQVILNQSDLMFPNATKIEETDIDETKDILAANSLECITFPQNNCEGDSNIFHNKNSYSIEDCESKNVQFRQQSENVSHLNEEFLRYCFWKAVNFET